MTSSTLVQDGVDEAEWGAALPSRGVPAAAGTASVSASNGLLSVSAALVGVLSYACTLLMANNLGSTQFSDFAAAQMLLGISGIIASALVPLPLSHAVAAHSVGSAERREGLTFAILVSLLVGTVAAVVTGSLAAAFAPAPMAVAVALSALALFLMAAPQGWLQGELRFKWYAAVSLGEVTVRLGFSLLVVTLAWGATGAVLGFALGALALAAVPLSFYRDLRFNLPVLRQRWRWTETGDIALVLCVVSVLIGLDVVVIAFLDEGSDAGAGFQALATIAKGPVYVAAGTALVAFPLLRSRQTDADGIVGDALRSFGGLALPAAAVIATAPVGIMGLVLPDRYHSTLSMLPWLAAAGLGYATLSVLSTILLALRRYRRCQFGLLAAALMISAGIFFGWHINGVGGLAVGSATGSLLAAAMLAIIARPVMPPGTALSSSKAFAAGAVLTFLLGAAATAPLAWLLVAGVAGVLVLYLQRSEPRSALQIASSVKTLGRSRWSAPRLPVAVVSLASFAAVSAVAFAVRAIGLSRSFELQGDELLYAELARSVSLGEMPNLRMEYLPDGPFFLHPPGFFLLGGMVIRALELSGSTFNLVYDLRWINATLGALTVGVGFLLVRRLVNAPIAWVSAIILTFEPFLLRNHSRVYLETLGTAMVLTGFLVVVSVTMRRSDRSATFPLFLGGALLGYGVLTKDIFALSAIAPVILAVVWRQTLQLRQALPILVGAAVPYTTYLIILRSQDLLPGWIWAKSYGARRMLGFEQETGFNAEGAPSLISRMIEQATSFGTSYVLLGLGPLAALLVCFSRLAERRLLGLAGLVMGIFGLYSAAFGTFEEQYGYPVMIAGIFSIAIGAMEVLDRRPSWRTPIACAGVLFAMLVVTLGIRAVTTTDNGFTRFKEWMESHLPTESSVAVTNITAELAFAELSDDEEPRFGAWPSPELMEENGAEYILTQSDPTLEGYGYAPPELLEWLSGTATEMISFDGPTNGSTTLWHIDAEELRRAANAGLAAPTENYYAER